MKDSEKALKEELAAHFVGHSKRVEMLVKLLLGLLHLGSVSYSKLSKVINPLVQRASNFKRIQRFMKEFSFSERIYVQFVWKLFVGKKNWVALSMDRTNWKFGKSNINILMLGISYKGTAIPLVWKLLNKRGNSHTSERIEVVEQLLSSLDQCQQEQIKCLLTDREFIGNEWISYLKKQSFDFVTRVRSNTMIRKLGTHKTYAARQLFKTSDFKVLRKQRIIWGHQLFIAGQQLNTNGAKKAKKEWLILVSNVSLSQGKQLYGERWGIEVFFAACKTRGFNFEDTHVTKLDRIYTLLFLIAIAFIWAIRTGEYLLKNGAKIPIKIIKNQPLNKEDDKPRKRRAKLYSIFRLGFDYLQERLLNFLTLRHEIRLLSCT